MPKKPVSLVLGSGGARGLAHLGVIKELESRGYKIRAISGSSMGAAIGGVYASGNVDDFTDWAQNLTKRDTFRLIDFTISSQGIIKGDRVLTVLKEMIGERNIEDLAIPFTAVATDIHKHEEVWLQKGNLYDVIRASSAVPTLITPHKIGDRMLVDGGVLNPLPIEPVLKHKKNLIVAININAKESQIKSSINGFLKNEKEDKKGSNEYMQSVIKNMREWLNIKSKPTKKNEEALGYFGLLNKSIDLMQDRLCEQAINLYKPDIVINIPRGLGTTFDLHLAKDLIEFGQQEASKVLDEFETAELKVAS